MMRRPIPNLRARQTWICTQCRAGYSSVAAPGSKLRMGNHNRKTNLPDGPARTRFAPSPTGYLHLGSLRTALFNYLLAKRTGGQFLLRIEDTDQKRTIPGAEQRLYDDLRWAGLQWDEGPIVGGPYGPYRQSERTETYRKHTHELIDNGHAYRCFCSAERLDAHARHRSEAGLAPGYDRRCAEISAAESAERAHKGEAHVVRLKVEGYPMFYDIVYGKTGQNRPNTKLDLIERVYDDPILLKSDGHPTYHLANVVDDHLMEITHVIRGTEWMASTPLHVALYNAFKWTPPQFGHVPLLVDKSGQKLSKRNADIDLTFFKDTQSIFAATLVNFAALLGWSHTQKSDVFNLEELEQLFNLKITRGNTVVAFEKLWFLQKAHAQRFASAPESPELQDMVHKLTTTVEATYSKEQLAQILNTRTLPSYITPLLQADAKSYTTPEDFLSRNQTFFQTAATLTRPAYTPASSPPSSPSATNPPTTTAAVPLSSLHTAATALTLVPPSHWTLDTHRANIAAYDGASAVLESPSASASAGGRPLEQEGQQSPAELEAARKAADKLFKKELYHYLRWALSGGAPGPGIPETMVILGREQTVRRLQDAKALTLEMVPNRGVKRYKGPQESAAAAEKSKDISWMGSLAPKRA
ncbi:glutamate--tRNA ligase MSE1 [Aspergillus saccharolyticus JOP 1030-1]|uniref:Glutamate--tRNA ligase, mitochondrial n=1 Tax=Aspergillus saccharolyticus JOP 1030-1 TaxID=1450539 RepID=A0A318ZA92_9EURO|nr:glutamyl-tRNA synthetase [Aspergillus saccharolyticus JOP 1030-1]PYH41623.1 glutamyl-tRNA synthetase [Aspergillus saccharolyticus JOP 1030-1]